MKKVLLSLLVILAALSCQKEVSPEGFPPGVGSPKFSPTPIQGSVAGVIVNENNNPVANASVSIGNSLFTTDNNGMFNTGTLTLDKYISTVKVSMAGYFTAYRSFCANATKNYVTIKLIPKTLAGSFSSTSTGTVSLPNGSSISFQANGVKVKSTNAPYTGTVNVYASYIDPTASDFGGTVPGSLMGEDVSNVYVLRSTGMMAVEIESAAGEPLQLESAKPATIKMTIPASLLGNAPATIDTWSLDNRGVWIKEGTATKNGNAYEFQVAHFSFWNCDWPATSIHLTINVKDQNGNNITNKWVSLTSSTTFGTTYGITDSLGNVSGMVPAGESLMLKVFAGFYTCNTPFYTQTIGPFSVSGSLNIVASIPAPNVWTLTGTATNCAGAPVQNGSVHVFTGLNQAYVTFTNGSFTVTLPSCSPLTSISLVVLDNDSSQQSGTITLPVNGNTINAGSISACGTSTDQFVNYIFDGTAYSITSTNPASSFIAMISASTTFLSAYNQPSGNWVSFGLNGASVGTFPAIPDSIIVNTITTGIPTTLASGTFTTFGPIGQYVEGNFNIPFTALGATHTFSGTFRFKRT